MSRSYRKHAKSDSRQLERRSKNRSERKEVKYSLRQGEYDLLPQSSPVEKKKYEGA